MDGRGGVCLVTADHGNAELMLNADGSPNTAHTTNPVPLIVTRHGLRLRDGGRLADVAPTVLELLGVDQPGDDDRHVARRVAPRRCGGRYGSTPASCGRMSILASGSRNQRFTSWPFRSLIPMCSDSPAAATSVRSR